MIKDKNINWNVRREFIPVANMTGLLEATNLITSLGAGAAVLQEVLAAAQLAGLQIGAAGDEIFHLWKLPWDIDRTKPIQARLFFFHSSADADTPDWKVFIKGLGNQQAASAANSSADATLTFAAAAVSTTANALEKTVWQKTTGFPLAATDLFAMLCIECNGLGSASANEISLMGIELAYTVAACGESPKRDDTSLSLDILARY